MKNISILSPAKLNLSLRIKSKRIDNFHEIESNIQIIDLFDVIKIRLDDTVDGVEVECTNKKIRESDNLAYIAANKFLEFFDIKSNIKIFIDKKIPLGSGLGGGSSNAASILIGLSKIFNLDRFEDLYKIACEIGSDVPLFLFSRSAILTGRGEIINLIKSPPSLKFFLIVPNFSSYSTDMYSKWIENETMINKYFEQKKPKTISFADSNIELRNDFLPILIGENNSFVEIFQILDSMGMNSYSVSGSGSSIFAIINQNESGKELMSYFESSSHYKTFICSSIEGWRFQID